MKQCTGHENSVECFAVHENTIWSASWDGTIRVWNSSGECIRKCTQHPAAITCIISFRNTVWSGAADGAIQMWSIL